jgi:hypothetical protein
MGRNGAQTRSLFVDGWLEGLWPSTTAGSGCSSRSRREQAELDDEAARVEALMAR